jgi:hypothetical protein
VSSCCEHSTEMLGSTEGREVLEWLRDLASEEGLCSMELLRRFSVSYGGQPSFWDETLCTLVNRYPTIWRHSPEDGSLHSHCGESLKSHTASPLGTK